MAAHTWIVLEGTVLEPCSVPMSLALRVCLSWWSHAYSHCHVGWRAQQAGWVYHEHALLQPMRVHKRVHSCCHTCWLGKALWS